MLIFRSVLFMYFSVRLATSVRWLALSHVQSVAAVHGPGICNELKRSKALIKPQIKFCRQYPRFMESVVRGAVKALDECQFQFKSRPWNCSTLEDIRGIKPKRNKHLVRMQKDSPDIQRNSGYRNGSGTITRRNKKRRMKTTPPGFGLYPVVTKDSPDVQKNSGYRNASGRTTRRNKKRRMKTTPPGFGLYPVVNEGTREAAFVHAIAAAGVAHSITKACSGNKLEDCGCDETINKRGKGIDKKGEFQWAGCSDNVAFGNLFSRTFVDARERGRKRWKSKRSRDGTENPLSLINLHNNEAGRKLLEANVHRLCKCHGMSGSCQLRTCWKALPSFRKIGELLKEKFDGAFQVTITKTNGRLSLRPKNSQFKPQTSTDLVYVNDSPDFCEFNETIGSMGTHGRACQLSSHAIAGCDLLCCHRGFKSQTYYMEERCNCKFEWCCNVKCRTCKVSKQLYTCL